MSDANVADNEDARDEPLEQADIQQEPLEPTNGLEAPLAVVSDRQQEGAEQASAFSGGPEELNRANERALRAQAELENFRKRVRREMEDERRYAIVPLITDLLPVIDNLDRAVEAAERGEGTSGLLAGVKMVRMQLLAVLDQFNCRNIDAVGAPFDPHLHEAIGKEFSDEHDAGVVTRVVRIGYQLHDRVVRPSQVLVSGGPPPSE